MNKKLSPYKCIKYDYKLRRERPSKKQLIKIIIFLFSILFLKYNYYKNYGLFMKKI